MTLGYPRSGTVWGFRGEAHRVNKCIFHTNIWSLTQNQMITKCEWPWNILQLTWLCVIHRCPLTVFIASSKHFCFTIRSCVFNAVEIFLLMHYINRHFTYLSYYLLTQPLVATTKSTGLKGQMYRLGLTAIRRGFELYECLLVTGYCWPF